MMKERTTSRHSIQSFREKGKGLATKHVALCVSCKKSSAAEALVQCDLCD